MDIEQITKKVQKKLDKYSEEVVTNIRNLIQHFNDQSNLTVEEKKATQISFWRSMDDKSCSAVIERLTGDDVYNDQIESKFQRFSIFKNWQDCMSWSEIFSCIEEDESLEDTLDTALEILYLQWFVKNWYEAGGHLAQNVEYYLIENNSVRNFDLKRFNFTDMFPNHKGIDRKNPYYNFKLNNQEIKNRILMDMIDHTYHKPIIRKLESNEKQVVFWYSKCELIIREIKAGMLPKVILAKKIKPGDNENRFKHEHLMYITTEIEKLIDAGYREVE